MTAPTPWLGTEPFVQHPDLHDEPWYGARPWWQRFYEIEYPASASVDRVCGPEYRMWEERT